MLGIRSSAPAFALAFVLSAVAGSAAPSSTTSGQGRAGADRADHLQSTADSLVDDGRYADAVLVSEELVGLRRRQAATQPLPLATALRTHAEALHNLYRLDEADQAAREAIALRRQHSTDRDPELASALYRGALILDRRNKPGDRIEGQRLLTECLDVRRRAFGPDAPIVLKTRVALALRDVTPGGRETGSRERGLRDCLADQRRALPSQHPDLIETLFWLSEHLKIQGEHDEALEHANEALAIQRHHDPNHPDLGFCLNQVATILTRGGKFAEATATFEQSVEHQRRTLGDNSTEVLLARANLASAYTNMGDPDRAIRLLHEVRADAERLGQSGTEVKGVFGSVNAKLITAAERDGRFAMVESLAVIGFDGTLKKLPETHVEVQQMRACFARVRAGQGDLAGAEVELNETIRLFEKARAVIGTGTAPATFDDTPYETRALVRLELGRFDDAWMDIEACRGRLLGESINDGRHVPLALADVQRQLAGDEAIVGWVDHQMYFGGGRSWAYVVRSTGAVQWERLPRDPKISRHELTRRYTQFSDRVVGPGTLAFGVDEGEFPAEEARALWKERLQPIEGHLRGVRHLVLVPSSAMAGAPLGALVDARGRKAIERWTLQYAPSATIRVQLAARETAPRPRRALFVGDPPFQVATTGPVHRGLASTTVRGALRSDRSALASLPRLAWSRPEVESISALFPTPSVLVGEAATEPALAELAASGRLVEFDVVHLSTHALMDGARPARSALVLAQTIESDSTWDGVVTAHEIGLQWKLGADLVTLSACETALGRNILGEGTVGFAYPLLRAGASSVLASLWSVNDESTQLLMRRFYENWLGTSSATAKPQMTKAQALRDAQLWLRDWRDPKGRQPFRHPYYWTAFILIGD